jgi:hypothetical protein
MDRPFVLSPVQVSAVKEIKDTSKNATKKRGRPKTIVKTDIKIIQGPITVSFS